MSMVDAHYFIAYIFAHEADAAKRVEERFATRPASANASPSGRCVAMSRRDIYQPYAGRRKMVDGLPFYHRRHGADGISSRARDKARRQQSYRAAFLGFLMTAMDTMGITRDSQ